MTQRHCILPLLWVTLLLAPITRAQGLLVSSRNSDEVLLYDAETGSFVRSFAAGGGLDNPVGITFGPDGHLYVASADSNQVLRYDGMSGAFLDVFVDGAPLAGVRNLNFGPDGDLYVANGSADQVLAFDGTTGAFLGVFAEGNGLNGPTSLTFGPDGHLYVGSVISGGVLRFDGRTGAFIDTFVSGVPGPHDVAFGPDGYLYVSTAFARRVLRFDAGTGSMIDVFVLDSALTNPLGLTFGRGGFLYVANQGGNEVRRYDARSGNFVDSFVSAGSGGLDGPLFMALRLESSRLTIEGPFPGLAGVENDLWVSGASPGSRLFALAGLERGARAMAGCPGLVVPMGRIEVLARPVADEGGNALLRHLFSGSLSGRPVGLQVLDRGRCELSHLVVHFFP